MSKLKVARNLIVGILLASAIMLVAAQQFEQIVTVTVLPGEVTIYSPIQDNVYTERMVPINLTMNTNVVRFEYFANNESQGTLCKGCEDYGFLKLKKKPFDDGFVQLKVVSVFEGGEVFGYRNFTVDTKKPKITKTEPAKDFATGLFSTEYQEANPTEIWLNYGNNATGFRSQQAVLLDCYSPSRNKMRCNVSVSLEDYDLQEIKYWFNITDIVNQSYETKPKKINVDISNPIINVFNWTIDGRRVNFFFNITEPNLKAINYIDWNDRTPKEKVLCPRLKNGICEVKKSFTVGEHNLTVNILDKAGNFIDEKISFRIV